MKLYIGIDNGLDGGIVILNEKEEIVESIVMPTFKDKGKRTYDIYKLAEFFSTIDADIDDVRVALEQAHTRPVSGKRANFMTGYGYGVIQGILESFSIPYEIVSPQAWCKELNLSNKEKKGSVAFCQRYFPKVNFKVGKSKKSHDGLTDATCLALYIKRRVR